MNTLLLAAVLLVTNTFKPSYTKEEIRAEYDKVVTLTKSTYKGKDFYQPTFDTNARSILTPFFREHDQLAEYLRMQYHQVGYEYHKRMQLGGEYLEIVQDNAQLAKIMFERFLPLISNTLTNAGSKIESYEPWKKPEITLDRLAATAAKFFYPDSIYTDGRVQSHICIGINGFQREREGRSVMIEAFCWSAIEPHVMTTEPTPLFAEYDKAKALAEELQLGSDVHVKLTRYQGVVWAQMSQSKLLRELLLAKYEKQKHVLTFTVKAE
jgi:hypothetical protein